MSNEENPIQRNNEPNDNEPSSQNTPSNEPHSPERKGPPRQPPQAPVPSPFWFVILLFMGAFLVLPFFHSMRYVLDYNDMMKLIDLGPESVKPDGHIIIKEESRKIFSSTKVASTVKYSNLRDIVVSNYEIRGLVRREVIERSDHKTLPQVVDDFPISTGRQGFALDNGKLEERLEKSGHRFRSEGNPSFFREHAMTFLMLAIMIPILFLLFRGIGGSGALAFGRNRGRLVSQEDIELTFNDVAGVDEAVEELMEIVAFLKTPGRFQVLGGRIPRGVLLVGPPGTGKTILAKAVAGEAGVPFYNLSGSDFVELYVGVGAARVRDLFEQAERNCPCIIFIDELDAIGKQRGTGSIGGHDERDQTLNALLVEMDGFSTNSGIIVMAATNRPEILDPALMRPGRFDRQVLVDRPDLLGREAILNVHAKKIKLDPSVSIKEIASITSGFVGADLAALVNEAALLAARAGKDSVTMIEFNEGVERVTTGLQKKQRVIKPEEKRRIAVHESGHAVVAFFTPHSDQVHKISIIPRGLAALGYTLQRPEDDRYLVTKTELESRIKTFLGGTIAEELFFDAVSTGAQNDLERATEIARAMVMDFGMSRLGRMTFRERGRNSFLGDHFQAAKEHSEQTAWEIDKEIRAIMDQMFDETRQLLLNKRGELERLTDRLLEKEVIESEELKEVIENQTRTEHEVSLEKELTCSETAMLGKETTPAPPQEGNHPAYGG